MIDIEMLGQRIKETRERRGWTQRRLGEEMASEMTPAWVSLVERGRSPRLSVIRLAEIAEALAVDAAYLAAGVNANEHSETLVLDDLPREEQRIVWEFVHSSRTIRRATEQARARENRRRRARG